MRFLASGRGGSYNDTNPIIAGCARLRDACDCQHSIAFRGRLIDARLQLLNGRGLESTSLDDGARGAFHYAQPLPVPLDHGFRPPNVRIEWCGRDWRDDRRVAARFLIVKCALPHWHRKGREFRRQRDGDGF